MDETENANPMDRYLEQQRQAQEALTARYKALQDSLTQRRLPFDPMLMRLAIGLSKGSKSGTFGEEISNAMTEVLDQSEKEATRQQSIFKAQAELEEKILQMRRQEATAAYVRGRYKPGQRPTVTGAATDAVTPSGASADMAPAGMPSVGGTTLAGPMGMSRYDRMSDADLASLMSSEGKSIPEIEDALEKRRRDNIVVKDGFVYNLLTGEAEGSGRPVTIKILNPDTGKWEPHETFENVSFALSRLSPFDPRYEAIVRERIFAQRASTDASLKAPTVPTAEPTGVPAVSSAAAPTVAQAPRRPTATESEVEKTRQTQIAEARGKAEGEEITEILRSAREADAITQQARSLKTLASDPNADQIFGILSRPTVAAAIGKLVETGIGANQFRIGIPELQTALTQAGLNESEMAKYQTALQLMTEFQLKMSQYVKGGISNYEQGLFAKASINPNDRPQTIMMKANAAILMSDFARKKAVLFDKSNMSVNEFRTSPEYQRLLDETNDKMTQVLSGKDIQQKASRPGRVTTQDIDAEMKRRGLK